MNELTIAGTRAQADIVLPLAKRAELAAANIIDEASYIDAAGIMKEIKTARKRIGEILDPFVDIARKAWKDALGERDQYEVPLLKAIAVLDPALVAWKREQDRIAAETARRIEIEQRKIEEEERLKEAQHLEQMGEHEAASAVLEQPIVVAPVVVPTAAPKVKGMAFSERFHAEVFSLPMLVKAAAEGLIPMGAVMANMTFLNSEARQQKKELKYPGVRVVAETSTVGR